MHDGVRRVRPGERVSPREQTPGMHREEAFADPGAWLGTVHTDSGVTTGWHHHGEYDTYIYVTGGAARIEYGPGGRLALEAEPGDFLFIPKGVVHREGTAAGSDGVEAVLCRVGSGQVVFNVDGPPEE